MGTFAIWDALANRLPVRETLNPGIGGSSKGWVRMEWYELTGYMRENEREAYIGYGIVFIFCNTSLKI